ncbi:MAG: hypothetical protein KDA22_12050, partial [Phycisphaerales bacterium]|nr:hypothetical protein [Phycisphaerales bacterium]
RGGLLLEVVVALALFVGGALFVMRSICDGIAGRDRSRQRQEAVDLARSAIARLEVGLINLSDLRSGRFAETGSDADGARIGGTGVEGGSGVGSGSGPDAFIVDASTERSPHRGLTMVEIRVRAAQGGDGTAPGPVLCTLRQLVRLRNDDAADASFLEDDLLEGLPLESPPNP